jgi:hypothetical protein
VQFLRPTHHRNHYVRDVSADEDRSHIRNNPGIPASAPPMGALAPPIQLKTYEYARNGILRLLDPRWRKQLGSLCCDVAQCPDESITD